MSGILSIRQIISHLANLSKSALVSSDSKLKDNLKDAKTQDTAMLLGKQPSGLVTMEGGTVNSGKP